MNIVNRGFIRLFERYMPDPLVLAAILSIAVFIAGMVLNGISPVGMSQGWYGGFFTLHGFAISHDFIQAAIDHGLKGLDYHVATRPEGPFWHSDPRDKDFPFWY